jgi:hypothetical protein
MKNIVTKQKGKPQSKPAENRKIPKCPKVEPRGKTTEEETSGMLLLLPIATQV